MASTPRWPLPSGSNDDAPMGSSTTASSANNANHPSRSPFSTAVTERTAMSRAGCGGYFSMPSIGLLWPRRRDAEHALRHAANLDLLRAFGDAVPAVVAVDVLEGLVTRVADAAVHLDGEVGRLAHQTVGLIVRHRHLVRDGHVVVAVEMPRRLVNEVAHHLDPR